MPMREFKRAIVGARLLFSLAGTNAQQVSPDAGSRAMAHPLIAEQDRPAAERSLYQNAELFGQPKEKAIA
jgi:hypothetical protein